MEENDEKNKQLSVDDVLARIAQAVEGKGNEKATELEKQLSDSKKKIEELTVLIDELKKQTPPKPNDEEDAKEKQQVIDFIKSI